MKLETDLTGCDERYLDLIDRVVAALVTRHGIAPENLMVVGASARDVLHSSLGHKFSLRGTTDVDLAIATPDLQTYEQITDGLRATDDTGIRFVVESIKVDLVPFGQAEEPKGTVAPRGRRHDKINVMLFQEVYDASSQLRLSSGNIRIPSPAGYCALKMVAWHDRSADGEYRDGNDLGVPMFWYQTSPSVQYYLYSVDSGTAVLIECELDEKAAAVRILGEDITEVVGDSNANYLLALWRDSRLDLLPRALGHSALPRWTEDLRRRQEFVDCLQKGLNSHEVR